jgi:putative FmdB family regulatory protein
MPTYEYRCANGHLFELFQRMSEDPVDVCPQCGAPAERLLSAGAGLLFKGSGFYITDYRSDSYKKAAEKDSGGTTKKDDAKGPAKADSSGTGGTGAAKSD